MRIQIHRIYEYTEPKDETRILVDKLWPRGISRAEARLDAWWKDIAPSTELRNWFGHDPEKWEEFKAQYTEELDANKELISKKLKEIDIEKPILLLYGARDEKHNQAVILQEYLEQNF